MMQRELHLLKLTTPFRIYLSFDPLSNEILTNKVRKYRIKSN